MFRNSFGNLLGKKIELKAPFNGNILSLTEVSDPVFSSKLVGDGCAIIPTSNALLAPADGKIIQIATTNHAIGLALEHGIELLIHIGLDTVQLQGKGFKTYINVGDKVKKGQKLLEVDLEFLKENGKNLETPIVITNMGKIKKLEYFTGHAVAGKNSIIKLSVI